MTSLYVLVHIGSRWQTSKCLSKGYLGKNVNREELGHRRKIERIMAIDVLEEVFDYALDVSFKIGIVFS